MNLLKETKSLGLMAVAAIFLFSASLSSCGETKKEDATDQIEETTTEMETETTPEEPMDSAMHEGEHHMDSAAHEEHPTEGGGEEHPAN